MSLLWTNHLTDPFISIQNFLLTRKPAPRLSHKSPLKGYMVTCYWHLSPWKPNFFFFAGNVVYDKTISIFFYQNLLLKVKVDWKNSKTSQDVLGLTAGVCLKASKKSQKDF